MLKRKKRERDREKYRERANAAIKRIKARGNRAKMAEKGVRKKMKTIENDLNRHKGI